MAQKNEITWTNKSVLSFSDGSSPIAAIERAARSIVFQALEAGWAGPPFNPVFIAKLMDVPIEPNANIADARTMSSENGALIEYNPNQPRERVRFSIAHELAHLLFPDATERVRNRSRMDKSSDNWQLELLCNLAASEFVMPFGSLPTRATVPSIEELMVERRKFDVSAEAFLIRVAKTSKNPLMMFCASPVSDDGLNHHYRVDYSVSSSTAPGFSIMGRTIPSKSVIYRCTAIGYTDSAQEDWVDGKSHLVECVGIPGYPGSSLPRVAGLIKLESSREDAHPIRYVHGNALDPRGEGNRLICQMVNDRARKWGGGIARRAGQMYPQAEQEFSYWLLSQPITDRLGKVHFSSPVDGIVIASFVAQEGFGKSEFPRIRYGALQECLRTIASYSKKSHFSIHMPRIGTGAAGGSWSAVEEMVQEYLVKVGLVVTVYDLPPKRQQLGLFD